ncbi:hypothetical protein CU560_24010 [Serratia ureilytica]|nr:hypothetical protein CU560_24010 [Serratia ureilytica]
MCYGGERTNLPGADLNAACSGPEGARPRDGLSNVGKANRLIGQRRGLPGAAPSALARSRCVSHMGHLTFIDRKCHERLQKNA